MMLRRRVTNVSVPSTIDVGGSQDVAGAVGEHVWLLDANGAVVASIAPVGTQSTAVLASCTGFSALESE